MTKNSRGLVIGTLPSRFIGISSGGIATHIEGLIENLAKEGIDVYCCYHKPFGVRHDKVIGSVKLDWIKYVAIGLISLLFCKGHRWKQYTLKDNLFISFYYGVLSRYVKNGMFDFIHIHSLYNPAAIALYYLKYDKRIIITDHGFWVKKDFESNKKALHILKSSFEIAHKVIFISDVAFDMHKKYMLGDLEKLVKISNPSSFSAFPLKANTGEGKKSVIFNGYNSSLYIKGLPRLLDAVNGDSYLSRNIVLHLICNEEAHEYVRSNSWNFEYKLYKKMEFTKVLDLYTKSDALVVPSRFESFGLVYTEALAVGIPVVGYCQMIKEFQNELHEYIGEQYDMLSESSEDLAAKIKECLEHPFNGDAVREKLRSAYDWEIQINKFCKLYYD